MAFQRQKKPVGMRPGVYKEKLMQGRKGGGMGEMGRFLITVTVPGSAGTIRFVVREKELVEVVIGTVLKTYAREGRLPVLGSDLNEFLLYSAYDGSEALRPWETIGCTGSRNFLLCKKQGLATAERPDTLLTSRDIEKKGKGGWKAWLNKSLSFRISPR